MRLFRASFKTVSQPALSLLVLDVTQLCAATTVFRIAGNETFQVEFSRRRKLTLNILRLKLPPAII